MSKLREVRDTRPFLVTQSESGYQLHTGEHAHISGPSRLDDDSLRFIADNEIPYIDFSATSLKSSRQIVNYPGPSPYVHPGPYSPLDLGPLELVANLARRDGFKVLNVPRLEVPAELLRLASSPSPAKLQTAKSLVYPSAQATNDRSLRALISYGDRLRIEVSELASSAAPGTNPKARALHRAQGILFYEAHMAAAGNFTGAAAWERAVHDSNNWIERLRAEAADFKLSGTPESAIRASDDLGLMMSVVENLRRKAEPHLGPGSPTPGQ